MHRPDPGEHVTYYSRYIELVPDGDDLLTTLATQMEETQALLAGVPADREEYRYAPGKWSIREVVGHLIDIERVFTLRALWFARTLGGELPAMEENDWAAISNAGQRPLAGLAEEWALLRRSSLAMFQGFDAEAWNRAGIASGNPITVRACAWIIAGHERWHRQGLKHNYGVGREA